MAKKKLTRNRPLPAPRLPRGASPGTLPTLKRPKHVRVPSEHPEKIEVPKIGRKRKKL